MPTASTLLSANVLHGVVALLWVSLARRIWARRSVDLAVSLLSLALVLPLAALAAHALPVPEDYVLLRVERWLARFAAADLPLGALGLVLVGGTTLSFVFQELVPALAGRGGRARRERSTRLEASLARVVLGYRRAGLLAEASPTPAIACLATDRPIAALSGLARAEIVVSSGLLAKVDDDQLDGIVAHELAHFLRGGNRRLFALWIARALQAPSPAALVAFRRLVDLHELACDELAARATARPAALASAILLVARPNAPRSGDPLVELRRRGERALTKTRVRALLDLDGPRPAPRGALALAALELGVLLWLIR